MAGLVWSEARGYECQLILRRIVAAVKVPPYRIVHLSVLHTITGYGDSGTTQYSLLTTRMFILDTPNFPGMPHYIEHLCLSVQHTRQQQQAW